MLARQAKLAFVDVETTGLSPILGDRIVEIAVVEARGPRIVRRFCQLVDPKCQITPKATAVHGLRNADVRGRPAFAGVAAHICELVSGAWVVGHNVAFDVGFMSMELALCGWHPEVAGCFDTLQLSAALWYLPNKELASVVETLRVPAAPCHRALGDALAVRDVFDCIIDERGGWDRVSIDELCGLHTRVPRWPDDPARQLPARIGEALTRGADIVIRYVNRDGIASQRTIRPLACFDWSGRTYLRAWCHNAKETRTFRVDRILLP